MTGDIPVIWHHFLRYISRLFYAKRVQACSVHVDCGFVSAFERVFSLMEGNTMDYNTLVTLPIEVLVHIVSFLPTCDKVRIRCISKTLRSISEVPSLWQDFIWSGYAPRDDKLLKHVLRVFGKHVKHFHFANYIASSKLEAMLKHCKNVTHLSLPSFRGNFDRLKKIVHCVGNIQILDVLSTCTYHQHFTLASNLKELRLHTKIFRLQQCLEKWANFNYVPEKLNILCPTKFYGVTSSLRECISMLKTKPLQRISSTGTSPWCSIYFTDYSATIPYVQLQVTDSSVIMSSVKASKYGILGLYGDMLHLTQGSYRGEKVQKALLAKADVDCVDTSIVSLTSVTYFDASNCDSLFPGHLEQLSIACPNLQRLNLSYNSDCLNNLQGLQCLALNCKSLRGLSLKGIHLHEGKCSRIELWEILCSLRLTQLAIEPCTIKQCDSSHRNAIPSSVASSEQQGSAVEEHQRLDHLFQRYTSYSF